MMFAVTHVVVDQISKSLDLHDTSWAKFAAAAAAAAAIATAILAWLTRNLAKATGKMSTATNEMVSKTAELSAWTEKSVAATREIIANDNANHRAATTIAVIAQFTQTTVPVTRTIALTPAAASSQIILHAGNLPELQALKTQYDVTSSAPQNEQYRVIGASIPIVVNFYMVAMQLLRRDLLDVPLFMNTFAKTFLAVLKALAVVNGVTNTASVSNVERLTNFKDVCERFLKDNQQCEDLEPD
jgi:hypothetical protein